MAVSLNVTYPRRRQACGGPADADRGWTNDEDAKDAPISKVTRMTSARTKMPVLETDRDHVTTLVKWEHADDFDSVKDNVIHNSTTRCRVAPKSSSLCKTIIIAKSGRKGKPRPCEKATKVGAR